MTGLWENKLRRIERGDYSAPEFISELKTQISEIVINVLTDNSARRIETTEEKKPEKPKKEAKPKAKRSPRKKKIESLDAIVCPTCGKGHIIKGRTAYGCSRYAEGCTCRLPFEQYPDTLTPAQLADKIKK